MTEKNLTIDRPITGDITRYTTNKAPQGGVEEFYEALDAVLDVEGVEAVRWEQYTPYFNDGEPCEFRVYDAYIKFVNDDESGDYEDGYTDFFSLTYEKSPGVFPYRPKSVTTEQAAALSAAKLNLDRFEDVLRENFGDPAQVVATKEGFSVEFYDHD